ncbi:DUF3616 domain-containing protein [uncultured Enterovirga sp.]|uniref:DUF3616 domain-containing protein n=1 Tax=uncultured Enterovirga sp. TaxID=2026352 RepID=UPI0035CC449F
MRGNLRPGLLGVITMAGIVLSSPGFGAEPFRYEGVCEASAAAILGERHFAVASDDTELLTIYERGKAAPVSTLRLPAVTDLEAAARIGTTIFWVTSHSLNQDGEDRTKRKLLFATAVSENGSLAMTGTTFRSLRERLARLLGRPESVLATSLNIEGLAATPDGHLLVGLRGPLTADGKAQVVKVDNPFSLVGLPEPARTSPSLPIATVSRLDLGGRGIRSIDAVGTGERRYLIVAGSVEDGGVPPLLYWWDGLHAATPGPKVSMQGLNPEALLAWSERELQIIGDNGDACSEKAKRNPRWFPSIDITLD